MARERDLELVTKRDEGWDVVDLSILYGVTVRSASTLIWRARRRLREDAERAS